MFIIGGIVMFVEKNILNLYESIYLLLFIFSLNKNNSITF